MPESSAGTAWKRLVLLFLLVVVVAGAMVWFWTHATRKASVPAGDAAPLGETAPAR